METIFPVREGRLGLWGQSSQSGWGSLDFRNNFSSQRGEARTRVNNESVAEICVPQSTKHTSQQSFTTSDLPAKLQPKVRVKHLDLSGHPLLRKGFCFNYQVSFCCINTRYFKDLGLGSEPCSAFSSFVLTGALWSPRPNTSRYRVRTASPGSREGYKKTGSHLY